MMYNSKYFGVNNPSSDNDGMPIDSTVICKIVLRVLSVSTQTKLTVVSVTVKAV